MDQDEVDLLNHIDAVWEHYIFTQHPDALASGEVRAQACLAGMYAAGIGVLQNLAEALKWYQSASEGGDAEAQANLGAIYANGSGVAKDYSSRSNAVVEKRSGAAAGESRKSPKG